MIVATASARRPRADQGDRGRGRPPPGRGIDHRSVLAQVGQPLGAEHVDQADCAQCGGESRTCTTRRSSCPPRPRTTRGSSRSSIRPTRAAAVTRSTTAYPLKWANASTISAALTSVVPDAKISPDPTNKMLIVTASEEDHKRIQAVLDQADKRGGGGELVTKAYTLRTAYPSTIVTALTPVVPNATISADPTQSDDCGHRVRGGPRADQGHRRRSRPPPGRGSDHRSLLAQVGQPVGAEHVDQADCTHTPW